MNTVKNFNTILLRLNKLDSCVGSSNTLYDFSNKVCVSNKTKDLNISVLLITIALLKAVSIYCYLLKYCAKKKIYYHFTTKKFKESILAVQIENEK